MSTLYGITSAIGADQLLAAGTITTTVAIAGATVGMVVAVTPEIYPNPGIFWEGLVTAPDTVRVKVTTVLAGEIPTTRYFVAVNTATTPADSLPQIVAAVEMIGIDPPFGFVLLASPARGQYTLADYGIVTTHSSGVVQANLEISYSDADGARTLGGSTSLQNDTLFSVNAAGSGPAPLTIQSASGDPIHIALTIGAGGMATADVVNAGTVYAVGDTGDVDSGGGTQASYEVLTVDGLGGVLTVSITNPGDGYVIGTGAKGTTAAGSQPGIGHGLTLDVATLSALGAKVDYFATLTRNA